MSEPSLQFNEVNERQGVLHRRTFIIGGFTRAGIAVLRGRPAPLQLMQTDKFRMASAENQFNDRLIPAPRGRILDRWGVEVASSRPNFRLLVNREDLDDPEATLALIEQVLPQTAERRAQLLREIKHGPPSIPVAVANDLTWDEFSRINVRTPELPGVVADMNEIGRAHV